VLSLPTWKKELEFLLHRESTSGTGTGGKAGIIETLDAVGESGMLETDSEGVIDLRNFGRVVDDITEAGGVGLENDDGNDAREGDGGRWRGSPSFGLGFCIGSVTEMVGNCKGSLTTDFVLGVILGALVALSVVCEVGRGCRLGG
jgi:hypothetical protein